MDYRKYYFLEEYLLGDVRKNFHRRGYLTADEFFCIVIWKANRAKTAIKKKLLIIGKDIGEAVRQVTSDVHQAATKEKKLELLLNKWNFMLPMATAILTILYPDDFTVYDVRVRDQLGVDDFSGSKHQVHQYFSSYLPKVKAVKVTGSLRDGDRYLWGKSFYEDLMKFITS